MHHLLAGGLRRAEGQDRIEFLAEVRNRALAPLAREYDGLNRTSGGFRADRIVFINDVFFCVRDVVSASDSPPFAPLLLV
jgi:hypothetical protein